MSFGMLPRYNLFLDCDGWKRNCGKEQKFEAAVDAAVFTLHLQLITSGQAEQHSSI